MGAKTHLYYELYLTNFSSQTVRVTQLEVLNLPDTTNRLTVFNEQELKRRWMSVGKKSDSLSLDLQPGRVAVLYLEIQVSDRHIPRLFKHLLLISVPVKNGHMTYALQSGVVPVHQAKPIVLGKPLSGGPWAAIHHPAWERGHRRVLFTRNGTTHLPGRFAIDFAKLDQTGKQTAGDADSVRNWLSYGQSVLAVADGLIGSTRTDFAESATLKKAPKFPADSATGNYLTLQIAPNRFVFYEHLRPGSIQVRVGQRVKKGDVIARVGFTGQSTGPHLHLHVANANTPLEADGLPFVFEQFTVLGDYPNFAAFGKAVWQPARQPAMSTRHEHPAPNVVVQFDK